MKIQVNGEVKELEKEVTILELLQIEAVKMPEMVSVEVNGEFIDREEFGKVVIKEDDQVEFLYFMGGGAFGF